MGPEVGRRLKSTFGSSNVGVEGVDYAALLSTNFLPGGADPAGIAELRQLLTDAANRCANAAIVAGGYRYGTVLNLLPTRDSHLPAKAQHSAIVQSRTYQLLSRTELMVSSLSVTPRIFRTVGASLTSHKRKPGSFVRQAIWSVLVP